MTSASTIARAASIVLRWIGKAGLALALPLASACGGQAIDSGDGDTPGDGDGDGDSVAGTGGSGPKIPDLPDVPEPEINDCVAARDLPGVKARYERLTAARAPRDEDFFAFPWPEISRPLVEYAAFPNPVDAAGCTADAAGEFASLLVGSIDPYDYRLYLQTLAAETLDFGARHPGIYVAFDGELAAGNLPSELETLSTDAPLFLMNVDPGSLQRGALVPLRTRVSTMSRYLPDNTLAAIPVAGFPLQANTRYAFVVKRSLGDSSGDPLGSSLDFEARKREDCPEPYTDYLDVFSYLEQTHSIERGSIAAMTVFVTGDPTEPSVQTAIALRERPAEELSAALAVTDAGSAASGHYLVLGTLATPQRQRGAAPFLPTLTGILAGESISFDADTGGQFVPLGAAADETFMESTEPVEFALTIPGSVVTSAMIEGVPLVIYGPGTGGSHLSATDEGIAEVLANAGFAVLSTRPVMHGPRAHAEDIDPALMAQLESLDDLLTTNYAGALTTTVESGDLFFNPLNLQAARGNASQAMLDTLYQIETFAEVPVEVNLQGQDRSIRFDADNIYFFGHSQGAGIGPLLAAAEHLKGAVLSGASGHIPSTILYKTKPADAVGIPQMIDYLVCDDPGEPLDELHPMLSLIGHWFEPVDGQLLADEFTGLAGKDLFVVVGRDDAYAPFAANHAITSAAHLNQISALIQDMPLYVPHQSLLDALYPMSGFDTTTTTLSGNRAGTTAAFRQYHDTSCSDDHFVYVCSDQAVSDWTTFLTTSLAGTPSVP